MASLEELLSSINSGAVNVTSSDAVKRQPRKPKAQSDLQKRLRGQAGAVNSNQVAKAVAEKRTSAPRATPPPATSGAASPSAPGAASPAPTSVASAASAVTAVSATAVAAGGSGVGPPPLAADAPLTMRLKRVLDLLRLNRDAHTFPDIRGKLHVDLALDSELLDQLSSHTHVTYDAVQHTLRYRPKIPGINTSTDLLNYLRRHTTVEGASSAVPMTGVRVADIADAYLAVMEDIKRLQAEGSIYVFGNTTASGDVVYAVQNMNIGPVSEAVVELFHNTRLPVDVVDLQWRVRDLGLKSALATRPVRKKDDAAADKKKKKRRKIERKFNLEKATNAHMRELFEGAQPVNIDTK
ncbi:hypothetical protein Vretimale_3416 [Volvox reticuliferus]|uniref:TFIIE beta domain-containing protein n=1 Tax=Volvox reticuliferus TaxID=1737510 RepID=A0A8J4D8U7_9CHLO|nr:hypothetical protein Vretifemale_1031 [Volvox reticuliferus]GIL97893.1 hypothetical protein Vretimale_3416 [Volvox reticuliferus]